MKNALVGHPDFERKLLSVRIIKIVRHVERESEAFLIEEEIPYD
jgi:hypothetical protein